MKKKNYRHIVFELFTKLVIKKEIFILRKHIKQYKQIITRKKQQLKKTYKMHLYVLLIL